MRKERTEKTVINLVEIMINLRSALELKQVSLRFELKPILNLKKTITKLL